MADRRKKITTAFNSFSLQNIGALNEFYSEDVEFCDPIKKITRLENLKHYYIELYKNVKSIRFDFHNFVESENQVACEWVMKISVKNLNSAKPYEVSGSSFFKFDLHEKVIFHRDYFDVGQMVYEKIPLIGTAVALIRSKL